MVWLHLLLAEAVSVGAPLLKRAYECFEKKAAGGVHTTNCAAWIAYATYETATGDTQKDES